MLGLEKFLGEDFTLSLDLKYKYTDYEQSDSAEEEAIRLAVSYKM